MSAAAARRRKQLARKKQQEESLQNGGSDSTTDPLMMRLNALLSTENEAEESLEARAYEALQLAQGQVRRLLKTPDGKTASVNTAYTISLTFLEKKRVSVASQLLAIFAEVLIETNTECTEEWIPKIEMIDTMYRGALDERSQSSNLKPEEMSEVERLGRLHLQFLRKMNRWSAEYGRIKYGHNKLHSLLGEQYWRIAAIAKDDDEVVDEDEEDHSAISSRSHAITHLAFAEEPLRIATLFKTLPAPTAEEESFGRNGGTAAERDMLLTRASLVFCATENLRDANILLRLFIKSVDKERDVVKQAKSYMAKTDGKAPTHVIFCSMLLSVCEKESRAGALFQWMMKSFSNDLGMMRPDVKGYMSKIGRIYFAIEPPPSMMSMMENMMGMMGGMGGGMNPAAMMNSMGKR